jgi:hypothetical protein
MPRSTAGFKDEASANEVERWLNRQEALGKPVRAHHDVLATAGATVRRAGRDDANVVAPVAAAPRVTFAPTPSGTPARPSSRSATRASASATESPSATAVPVPGARASTFDARVRGWARAHGHRPGHEQASACVLRRLRRRALGERRVFRRAARSRRATSVAPGARRGAREKGGEPDPVSVRRVPVLRSRHDASKERSAWWKENALRTTLQTFDAPVNAAAAKVPGAAADAETKRRGFVDAARGTRLYYGDLFSDEGARRVDSKLRDSTPEEAVRVIQNLRAVHAGTATHRLRTSSATATDFRQGFVPTEADARRRAETARRAKRARAPPEDPAAVEARVKRKAEMMISEASDAMESQKRRDAAAARVKNATVGVSCDPANAKGGKGKISCTDGALDSFGNDFESLEVPRFASSYAEKQCAHMPEIVAQTRAGGHLVRREEKATMPFGEGTGVPRRYDPDDDGTVVIGIWQNRPGTVGGVVGSDRLYPIPRYLTRRRPESAKGKRDASSTSRRAFPPQTAEFGEARAAEVRATIKANKTKRSESRVPLGVGGITDHPRHRMTSSYVSDYVQTHERRVRNANAEKENVENA